MLTPMNFEYPEPRDYLSDDTDLDTVDFDYEIDDDGEFSYDDDDEAIDPDYIW